MPKTNALHEQMAPAYRISAAGRILTDQAFPLSPLFLGDYTEEGMRAYFESGYKIFVDRLEELRALRRPVSPQEEKELEFMLTALISAKNILEQKDS